MDCYKKYKNLRQKYSSTLRANQIATWHEVTLAKMKAKLIECNKKELVYDYQSNN